MSIESTIVSTVEGAAVSATPLGIFKWLKIGACAAAVLFAVYVGYRVVSFVEQAASDHAAVQVITGQLHDATAANAANLKTAQDAAAQHEAVIASANAATAAAAVRTTQLEADLETLRHAPFSSGCKPSPAVGALFNRLR